MDVVESEQSTVDWCRVFDFIKGRRTIATALQPDNIYFLCDLSYGYHGRRKRIPKPERSSQLPVELPSVIQGDPYVETFGVADPAEKCLNLHMR